MFRKVSFPRQFGHITECPIYAQLAAGESLQRDRAGGGEVRRQMCGEKRLSLILWPEFVSARHSK